MTDSASGVDSATDGDHDASWSANLEGPEHAMDRDLIVEQAKDAVESTTPGYHVNLVTHGDHGHPETYLWPELEAAFDGLRLEYVDRCGCGGHVTRAHVLAE